MRENGKPDSHVWGCSVRSIAFGLFVPAALLALLNCLKPVHSDDTASYYYAAHIARHPLDPYGFEVFWYQTPCPANEVLAPPVLPYWWAAGIRLFGDRPALWKLWLLPFCLLFAGALRALFRRFARGLEGPLVWMTALSPVFLPSVNLMLDVPALGLGLSGVAVFLAALDRGSFARAALAGLLAGLAMQTKYTALLAPAAMLLAAFFHGKRSQGSIHHSSFIIHHSARQRLLLWVAAALVAGVVFVGWELFVAKRYGVSHFVYHYRESRVSVGKKLADFSLPLAALLGGVASPGIVLGLAALKVRGKAVACAAGAVVLEYGVVACWGRTFSVGEDGRSISSEQVLFSGFGFVFGAVVVAALGRLLVRRKAGHWPCFVGRASQPVRVRPDGLGRPSYVGWRRRRFRGTWFLALWLALELGGYFVMTPFGAVRRVMGLVIVATLVLGRLASRTCRAPARRRWVWLAAGISVALGLAFWGVDVREAVARKRIVSAAAEYVREKDPGARIWFVGHWEFQFYAERAGLWPVVPGESKLAKGDWLVVPDLQTADQQDITIDPDTMKAVPPLTLDDMIPLRTVWSFYGTGTGVPLQHRHGPRVEVTVYQITSMASP